MVYIGLNALFGLIAVYTTPGFPTSETILIAMLIFGPAAVFPSDVWVTNGIVQLINTTNLVADFLIFIAGIVPPLAAVIVASLLAENPSDAFGAWALSVVISCGVYVLLYVMGQGTSVYIESMWLADVALYSAVGLIVKLFLGGVINCLFYGCIAMLITKKGL